MKTREEQTKIGAHFFCAPIPIIPRRICFVFLVERGRSEKTKMEEAS